MGDPGHLIRHTMAKCQLKLLRPLGEVEQHRLREKHATAAAAAAVVATASQPLMLPLLLPPLLLLLCALKINIEHNTVHTLFGTRLSSPSDVTANIAFSRFHPAPQTFPTIRRCVGQNSLSETTNVFVRAWTRQRVLPDWYMSRFTAHAVLNAVLTMQDVMPSTWLTQAYHKISYARHSQDWLTAFVQRVTATHDKP